MIYCSIFTTVFESFSKSLFNKVNNWMGLSFVNNKYKFYFLIKINTAFNVVVHMRLLL